MRELERLIDETETDLERVLAYYKVASLGEMNETAYRRAIEVLKRKLAKPRQPGRRSMPRIERLQQNTPEWHRWRLQGIGRATLR